MFSKKRHVLLVMDFLLYIVLVHAVIHVSSLETLDNDPTGSEILEFQMSHHYSNPEYLCRYFLKVLMTIFAV